MPELPRTEVHNERVVYDGQPWLRVTRHEITTPDGARRSHHAIRLNPVASTVVVDDQGRALLMRRHRWIVDQVGYETPGGIIDPGEDPQTCARRELLEETGFEVGAFHLAAILEPMPGLVETPHYVYIADEPRQVAEPTDEEEAAQLVWMPLTDTPELLATGQLLGAGTAVGMLSALALHTRCLHLPHPAQQPVVPGHQTP
ncbi:NUDIX hydrolase [Nocardia terpenica]|uniref:NUDIX domain-containing protein n=1 Tax=Nocardia terpenica TaxID=455432 RepID=A0A6G9ZDK2_9NOCA|nr:NUDIX hydrolase [Nocardia terpenica]QIS23699.1 NUDIX domain-containing protein [Nocardia terpenica]